MHSIECHLDSDIFASLAVTMPVKSQTGVTVGKVLLQPKLNVNQEHQNDEFPFSCPPNSATQGPTIT